MFTSPTLLSQSDPSQSIMPTFPLQILLTEDVEYPLFPWQPFGRSLLLQAALVFFFCQIFVAPPPPEPRPTELGEGGKEGGGWRKVRPVLLIAPLAPFLLCFFLSFLMNSNHFHFFATAAHTILVSPPPPPILFTTMRWNEYLICQTSQNHRRTHTHLHTHAIS